MNGRGKIAALVLAGVIVAGVAGWFAGSQIDSPADIAARAEPPSAAPILVPAEERVLSSDIVTRGTARFGAPQQLSLAASILKNETIGIAGRLPIPGSELKEGDVAFTTSGRPVFLLAGAQPAFRDMGPGVNGDDVRQLEDGLARLGFDPGPVDGVYDGSTEVAVAAWYDRAGFAPFTATAAQLAAVRALEADRNNTEFDYIATQDSLTTAQAALETAQGTHARALEDSRDAQPALAAAIAGADANNRAAAAAVVSRQNQLNLKRFLTGVTPADIAAAESELILAQANAEATRIAGERDVAAARGRLLPPTPLSRTPSATPATPEGNRQRQRSLERERQADQPRRCRPLGRQVAGRNPGPG